MGNEKMEKELEIRMLTKRFFDGETTLEEERRLYELYRTGESLPADLMPLREMMRDMSNLLLDKKEENSLSSNGEREETHLYNINKRWSTILAIAASLLLLFTVGTVWYNYQRQNECVAYIYGERVTDHDVVIHEMQSAMASLTVDDATSTMEQQMKELFND